MTEMGLYVDCSDESGPGHTLRPLTDEESAAKAAALAEVDAAQQDRDARMADRAAAGRDIKKLARQGKQVDAATFARYVGIDVNAPDPTAPGGG